MNTNNFRKFKTASLYTLLLLVGFSFVCAQTVTREEFNALQERLDRLESLISVTHTKAVESIASEVLATVQMNATEKSSLIENVVQTIQAREEDAVYPWMEPEKWSQIKKGMSPEAIRQLLGSPTLNEPSLHKRIDIVYTYAGRRVATNKRTTGVVRFYKNRVVNFEAPEL